MQSLLDFVERFEGKRIAVIGDIIADIFVFGRPYRLSREAPVVVVKYEEERVFPGSAGNTVNNLISLGAIAYPIGILGNDDIGNRLIDYFTSTGRVRLDHLIQEKIRTTTKTRILAGDTHTSKQQVIRIDRIEERRPKRAVREKIVESVKKVVDEVDAIIVSDYGLGVVERKVLDTLRIFSKKKLIVGDSRYNLKDFHDFTIITPNEQEATDLVRGKNLGIEELGRRILKRLNLKALLITRGNMGMSLFLKEGDIHHIPIYGKDEVTDVTGAGDTVCAALSLSLASGADFLSASKIANLAAGVVVMKRGTATVSRDELKRAILNYGKDST